MWIGHVFYNSHTHTWRSHLHVDRFIFVTKVTYADTWHPLICMMPSVWQWLFSSAWLCQCYGAGIHRSSVNWGLSETTACIQGKVYKKLPICHVSRLFFFLFPEVSIRCSDFCNFFFIFLNMGPYGSKHFKMPLLRQFFFSDLRQTF